MADLSWLIHLDRNAKGEIRPNLSNAVEILHYDANWGPAVLWRDEFLDRVLTQPPGYEPREWRADDDTRLTCYIQLELGIGGMPDHVVKKAVQYVASQRLRHVVRDYLLALEWDGEERLEMSFEDHWDVTCGPLQPCNYVRAASANFYKGFVARILRPGCQLDTMVVFEGAQGIGKTSALRVLGGPYYAAAHESVTHKDFFEALRGKWIIEIGEMDAFGRAEVTRVKTVISTPMDRYRPSYGAYSLDYPRQCIFAGTTNKDDWATDETGVRRFIPISCGPVNLQALTDIRDQLLAEAVHRIQADEPWWLMPDAETRAVQADRQADDPWTDLVLTGLGLQGETSTPEVLMRILKIEEGRVDRGGHMRVARILKLAGWTKKTVRRNGTVTKRWLAPE